MIMKMRNMMKRKNGQKGFTLIELIVVMAILAILAAIAVPKYNSVTTKAKQQALEANVRTIVSAIQLYQAANDGNLPTTETLVNSFLQKPIANMSGEPQGATYSYSGTVSAGTVSASLAGGTATSVSLTASGI